MPPVFPPDRFAKAEIGARSSNLAVAQCIAASIDSYMDDSDESNLAAVGHRRWCLYPPIKKTGLGWCNGYSAMWTGDRSGGMPKDLDTISYPPPGFTPVDFFGSAHMWHVSFTKGAWPARLEIEIRILPLDERYLPEGDPLPLEHVGVADGGYGINNCIRFRPTGFQLQPGLRYLVTVSLDGGKSIRHEQLVEFALPVLGG